MTSTHNTPRQPYLRAIDRYKRIVHPLIAMLPAVLLPLLVFSATIDAAGLEVPYAWLLPAQLIVALLVVVSEHIFRAEHSNKAARFREFVLIFGLLYLLVSLRGAGDMSQRLAFRPDHFYILGPVFLTWWIASELIIRLEARSQVLELKQGTHGERLNAVLRDNNEFVGETIMGLRSLLSSLTFGLVLVSSYTVALVVLTQQLGWPVILWYPPLALVYLVIRAYVFLFVEELSLASEGLQVPYRNIHGQIRLAAAILLIAGLLAVGASRNQALIPADVLLYPLNGAIALLNMLTDAQQDIVTELPSFEVPSFPGESEPLPEAASDTARPSRLLPLLRQILLYGIIAVGAAFLLAPFFTKSFRQLAAKYGFLRSIRAALSYVFVGIWSRVRMLIGRNRGDRQEYARVAPAAAASRVGTEGEVSLSREKRRELDVLERGYARLTDWAAARKILYRASEPPQFFAARIAREYPGIHTEVYRFIEIFEEGLYSSRRLSGSSIREFQLLLRTIRKASA